jgi:hypothetical protein
VKREPGPVNRGAAADVGDRVEVAVGVLQLRAVASCPPAAEALELASGHEARAGPGLTGEIGNAATPVEVDDGGDDGLTLRARPREPHRVLELTGRHIHSDLHVIILADSGRLNNRERVQDDASSLSR